MRKWIVLASHDENGQRLPELLDDASTLERVTDIITGDGERPMPGDITEAFSDYPEGGEFLFVPLDGDTFSGKVAISQNVEVVWEGNYV
jgi:hypothetical protein